MEPEGTSSINPSLIVERRGGAVWMTLNRPDKLNAIDPSTVAALDAAVDQLGPEDRCVVITGNGRAFSAGGDLAAVENLVEGGSTSDNVAAFHASISAVLDRLDNLPIPTVCMVNGLAVAGGLEIACACDIVVSTESAVFGDGHAIYGLLPGGGGSVRLPRIIGVARAKYLMLTGRQVPAQTMHDWGLVSLVAPAEDLQRVTEELVFDLNARSRQGLGRMKALIDRGLEQSATSALENEQVVAALHTHSRDYSEGLAAFRERRPPQFD